MRKRNLDEIFTPEQTVIDMLALLPNSVWAQNKTFLDPACGTGNILVEVLKAKIGSDISPLDALWAIYGVDLMSDNVSMTRRRLLNIVSCCTPITPEHIAAVVVNIVCANALTYDYEFKFDRQAVETEVRRLWKNRHKKG